MVKARHIIEYIVMSLTISISFYSLIFVILHIRNILQRTDSENNVMATSFDQKNIQSLISFSQLILHKGWY